MLVDTHCHIKNDELLDLFGQAKENFVDRLIISLCDEEDIKNIDNYASLEGVYYTAGIHPLELMESSEFDLSLIEKLIGSNKIVAIGEIGLDYYYQKENKKEQQVLFKKQLDIAKKYDVPIVIHSRDATLDTINILKEYNLRGVIHCFSGSLETAKEYVNLGYYLGIGGVVTFKNSGLGDVIKNVSLDHIVLETDSPYLSPDRGKINTPANIKVIAEYIANLKNVSFDEVSSITTKNATALFDL